MRRIPLLFAVVLTTTWVVGSPSFSTAQQTGFRLWPFDDREGADPAADDENDEDQELPWLLRSPLANVSWPEIKLPRLQILPDFTPDDRRRILGQNGPSLRERLASARDGMAQRSRQAWNRTLDMLKFGQRSTPQRRNGRQQRSFYERLFGSREPTYEGPRTVGEWLEQDRLQP